ncbi:hypothetical protein HU200_036030 [Digitaria exilis]|uniref:Uncharacterized protein n=1 Tax=Digitaria exilis TaxID=1010633 RepID=A0A835EIK6_9POAL|nr:hypothetical protein HU200_036030 [Digitaria exilis]
MLWEQYRGGWVDEGEDTAKVAGGSVLVERVKPSNLFPYMLGGIHEHEPYPTKLKHSLLVSCATKPLSLFKSKPEAAYGPPPEGRNSGYLVAKGPADEETRFWGLWI